MPVQSTAKVAHEGGEEGWPLPRQLSFQIWVQDGPPAAAKRASEPRHSLLPLVLCLSTSLQ